ncbi:MAG: hypothetical protein JXN64_15245 [Spirochaetes bacterium]|nr:hypothetical protein [Spirochaetota bacterium]
MIFNDRRNGFFVKKQQGRKLDYANPNSPVRQNAPALIPLLKSLYPE